MQIKIQDNKYKHKLPASGEVMFTGGKLLGQFDGPAADGQYISIQGDKIKKKLILVITYINCEIIVQLLFQAMHCW